MMTMGRRSLCVAVLASMGLIASGCDQRHPAETAGQKIDRAAETAGEKIDRAAETAGQKIDRAADKIDRAGNEAAAKTKEAAAKAATVLDDTALTAKVKAALFAEPGLKTLQIDVETHGGVVTLAGAVDSAVLRQRAVEIAGAMMGVREVVDKLVVKS